MVWSGPTTGTCRARRSGEWRSSGERKYYLSNLQPGTSRRALVGAIKARWVCEQGHQQLKEELGLDHFEGRSWTGLHRHALMTCMAYAYLQHLRLSEPRRTERGKNEVLPHFACCGVVVLGRDEHIGVTLLLAETRTCPSASYL